MIILHLVRNTLLKETEMLNLGEVEAAAARLRPHLLPTPLE
ncbi:hypothetical protein [Candidatus Flexifilum breve]